MFSTYQSQDVTILLKDITGLVTPLGTREREARIQSGVHYSEMLPLEYEPSPAYLAAYHDALERYAGITAEAVARAAEQIWESRGRQCALVSLARAGTPIGILIRRYLQGRYGADLPHYTISIIRGRGIDRNAMAYLLNRHAPGDIQFVDGWTGKGAIQRQLDAAMTDYPGVSPGLTVLSDPANVAAICGTHDDFLIASSCLNSTVSGLLSRTFLRGDIIGPGDFADGLYKEAAAMVFEEHKKGNMNPAQILNHFIGGEEQYREVAALFHASLSESLNNEEQRRALSETVKKIKKHSLEVKGKTADIRELQ